MCLIDFRMMQPFALQVKGNDAQNYTWNFSQRKDTSESSLPVTKSLEVSIYIPLHILWHHMLTFTMHYANIKYIYG